MLHHTEQVNLNPVLLHLAVHHTVELHAGEGYFLAGRREALELALMGTFKRHPRRDRVPLGRDVLYGEPKIGKRLGEGGSVLPPGLQALQVQGAGASGT